MNAVISGCAGVAILVEGQNLFSIDMLHPVRVPRQAAEVPHLLGEGRDLVFLEDVALDEVQRRLVEASDAEDALRMALRLLDGELAEDIRTDAAEDLEGLLASPGVEERVERVLFAHPFPSGADPTGAVAAAKRASATKASAFLRRLVGAQPAIEEVCGAWGEIPIDLLASGAERARAQQVMVREGVFRGLAMARAEGSRADSVVALSLQKLEVKALPGYRAIFQAWIAKLPAKNAPVRAQDWKTEQEAEPLSEKRDSHPARTSINRAEVFEKVKSHKAQIVRALDRHDMTRAWGLIEKLVTYQLSHGGAEFAVKSLCDLAKEAQRRGILEAQVELTARAVALGPRDGWAWAQRGKALLDAHKLSEALEACDRAVSFFDDVAAQNGRAEVLKALGRFDDALKAYNQIRRKHPDNVVTKNGRAQVLKVLGRFVDALKAYDQIRSEHPDNVVAKTGRAEVLKALGRFDDALEAYNQTRREHPADVVAKSGMACVLAVLGRSREALELLSDKLPGSEQDWIGLHIRGMILLRSGNVNEAISIFERGAANSGAINRDYYWSALALARLHLRDYAAAATVLEQISSPLLRSQTTVLRVHSFGAQGQFQHAAEAYKQLPPKTPPIIADLLEELRRRFVDQRPALHDDAWLVRRELDYGLASL
jgi:tetratricopeptide (TPR) repeat protein